MEEKEKSRGKENEEENERRFRQEFITDGGPEVRIILTNDNWIRLPITDQNALMLFRGW